MKLGIVRRIDELGRIVIPKGIRESLRIKNGDTLEIYIEDENIILKKHSELNKLLEIELAITNVLKEKLKSHILFTDKDKIIIDSKQKYTNEKISNEFMEILNNRNQIIEKTIYINEKIKEEGNILVNPIILNGDLIGSVIIISKDEINENNIKMLDILTSFLIKYIE